MLLTRKVNLGWLAKKGRGWMGWGEKVMGRRETGLGGLGEEKEGERMGEGKGGDGGGKGGAKEWGKGKGKERRDDGGMGGGMGGEETDGGRERRGGADRGEERRTKDWGEWERGRKEGLMRWVGRKER